MQYLKRFILIFLLIFIQQLDGCLIRRTIIDNDPLNILICLSFHRLASHIQICPMVKICCDQGYLCAFRRPLLRCSKLFCRLALLLNRLRKLRIFQKVNQHGRNGLEQRFLRKNCAMRCRIRGQHRNTGCSYCHDTRRIQAGIAGNNISMFSDNTFYQCICFKGA